MRVEKTFKMEKKSAEVFDQEIIDYMKTKYGCREADATLALQNALAYIWSVCNSPNGIIGVETNAQRDIVYVGR